MWQLQKSSAPSHYAVALPNDMQVCHMEIEKEYGLEQEHVQTQW